MTSSPQVGPNDLQAHMHHTFAWESRAAVAGEVKVTIRLVTQRRLTCRSATGFQDLPMDRGAGRLGDWVDPVAVQHGIVRCVRSEYQNAHLCSLKMLEYPN